MAFELGPLNFSDLFPKGKTTLKSLPNRDDVVSSQQKKVVWLFGGESYALKKPSDNSKTPHTTKSLTTPLSVLTTKKYTN